MPRRYRPPKRTVTPDPVYNSEAVAKFVNIVMRDGKRAVAERVMYDALRRAGRQARKEPIDVFDQALRNATPLLEVKPRRVGGATYQVPIEIRPERRLALALVTARPTAARGLVGPVGPIGKEVLELMNLSRTYAVAFGVVYTIVGLIGFAVSTTLMTANLVIFPVNVIHNVVHLAVGLLGLGAFLTGRSVLYARVMAVLFAVLTVVGFLPQPFLGLVPLGGADIFLHAMTAILAGVAGWAYADREVRQARA